MANSDTKRVSDDPFDLERIRHLILLMREHDLSEIDLRREKQQIRLARGGAVPLAASVPVMAPAVPQPTLPPTATPAPPSGASDSSEAAHLQTITSPMVGTLYLRPNPNAEPFVKVGDHISPETVVCIIEAMKVFNEIAAEVSGKIVAVLATDMESVEFGTPLFRVDRQG